MYFSVDAPVDFNIYFTAGMWGSLLNTQFNFPFGLGPNVLCSRFLFDLLCVWCTHDA